jgi:hypothetical protein
MAVNTGMRISKYKNMPEEQKLLDTYDDFD